MEQLLFNNPTIHTIFEFQTSQNPFQLSPFIFSLLPPPLHSIPTRIKFKSLFMNLIENLKNLQTREEEFIAIGQALKETIAGEEKELAELNAFINKLDKEASMLPGTVATAQKKLAEAKEMNMAASDKLEAAQSRRNYRLTHLGRGVQQFETWLGMKISRLHEGTIRTVFSQIDPVKVDREFSMAFAIDKDDQFVLQECEPALPGIAGMIEDVNADGDLGAFLRTVRAGFKELVQAEAARTLSS